MNQAGNEVVQAGLLLQGLALLRFTGVAFFFFLQAEGQTLYQQILIDSLYGGGLKCNPQCLRSMPVFGLFKSRACIVFHLLTHSFSESHYPSFVDKHQKIISLFETQRPPYISK